MYEHIDHDTWLRMATWVDSEGCITILASGTQRSGGFSDVRLCVSQADLRLMRWLVGNFGGSINPSKGKKRVCYNWQVGGKKAEEIIKNIRPYLIVKPEQADLALAYRATVGKRTTKALTKDVVELRSSLKTQLQHIKRNPPNQEQVQ